MNHATLFWNALGFAWPQAYRSLRRFQVDVRPTPIAAEYAGKSQGLGIAGARPVAAQPVAQNAQPATPQHSDVSLKLQMENDDLRAKLSEAQAEIAALKQEAARARQPAVQVPLQAPTQAPAATPQPRQKPVSNPDRLLHRPRQATGGLWRGRVWHPRP